MERALNLKVKTILKKILLLGDIHANTVALQRVFEDAGDVDEILCVGDIVDYNPWPLEAIEMVKTHGILSVIGNHDRDSALGTPVGYNPYAEVSCLWTHKQLGSNERRYLLSLPEKLVVNREGVTLFICHGSPDSLVDEYVYPPPMTPKAVLKGYLDMVHAEIVVLGHTHVPFVQKFPEGYVVNPGSVGQPRSGDPRASYVLITVENGEVSLEHRLVEYDIREVATKILEVGLPHFLARRLYVGV